MKPPDLNKKGVLSTLDYLHGVFPNTFYCLDEALLETLERLILKANLDGLRNIKIEEVVTGKKNDIIKIEIKTSPIGKERQEISDAPQV